MDKIKEIIIDLWGLIKLCISILILVPFVPIIVIMLYVFGKSLEFHSKMPEDLDEQYKSCGEGQEVQP